MTKTYSGLIKLPTFTERLEYLKLLDNNATSPRHMSEQFYKSRTWRTIRQQVIDRDLGFDLGIFGVYILDTIIIHHIEPIDEFDIVNGTKKLLDLDNLITVSLKTHNAIHYKLKEDDIWVERRPGDTKLW